MLGVKLSIIFVFLFCSFSVIILSEELIVNPDKEISDNNTENNRNNEFQGSDSEPSFNIFNIVYLLISAVVGFFLGIIKTKNDIKIKERRDVLVTFSRMFQSLLVDVENKDSSITHYLSGLINGNITETDTAFKAVMFSINNRRKRKKIAATYHEYKYPNPNLSDYSDGIMQSSFKKSICLIYDNDEDKMRYEFGEGFPFKDGKDLLIHNIQQIINLTK